MLVYQGTQQHYSQQQKVETTQISLNRRMDKQNTPQNKHTMDYYLTIKNKVLVWVTTWLNLETVMLSEVGQTQNKKCRHPLTWNI